jgi:hypothetical protein
MLEHFSSLADDYGQQRAVALPPVRLLAPVILALLVIAAVSVIVLRKAPRLFEAFVLLAFALGAAVLLIPGRAFVLKNSATAAISYLPPVLLVLTFAGVIWQFKNRRYAEGRQRWWEESGSIVIVALFALGAYSEVYPRADYAHLVRILPPVFLLLFIVIERGISPLATYFQNYLPSPRRAALVCAGSVLALLFIIGIKDAWQPRFDSSLRFVEQTPLDIERARGIRVRRRQAEFIEGLDATIRANSSADEYIFSFAPRGTAFYFLSARRNPTRLVWWRSAGIKNEDRVALLDSLANRIPKLVLVPEGFHNERVLQQLDASYHQIATIGDIAIYDRNQ